MVDTKQAALLLSMARKDLSALKGMQNPEVFSEEIFGFHVQQAAEKALKSWVALVGIAVPKTHVLANILELLEKNGCMIAPFWELLEFQLFAVQYRYESILDQADCINRQSAVALVELLVEKVESFF